MKVSVNASQFGEANKLGNLTKRGDSEISQSHPLFLSAPAAVSVKMAKALQQEIAGIDVVDCANIHLLRQQDIQG